MSNWKVGPGGRLYHPTTGAYVGQLDLNGNEQMVLGITTTSDQGIEISAGADRYTPARKDPRYRIATAPSAAAEIISDMTGSYAAITPSAYTNSSYKFGTVDLPDGTRRWGIKCKTKLNEQVNIDLAISRQFSAGDTLDFEMYIPEYGMQPNIYLTSTNIATYLRYNSFAGGLAYSERHGIVNLRVNVGKMVASGGATIAEVMTKLRVSFWNTTLKSDATVWLLGVTLNKKETPNIIFTTDDGFQSNDWIADQLKSRNMSLTAYIITSRPDSPPARYMSWPEVSALKSKGNVQIASHSHSHIYINGGTTGYVAGSTINGICLAQPVAAGTLLLNGSIGAAAFDRPRHLTFVTTGTNYGVSVTVVGELDGVARSETIWLGGANGYPFPTRQVYDKVTSLTIALNSITPAGNVTVGTSCSYDEIYADLRKSFEALESRGLSSSTDRHYCAPQGMWNLTLMQVLTDLGVKSCRLTDQTIFCLSDKMDWHNLPAMQWDNASYANYPTIIDLCSESGSSLILYTHDIYDSGAPAGASDKPNLIPVLDKVAGLVASGSAASPTMSDLYAKTRAF